MMKKKLAMVVAGILALGMLSGCSGKNAGTSEPAAGQEAPAGEETDAQESGGG